jgi:hypothetical protein
MSAFGPMTAIVRTAFGDRGRMPSFLRRTIDSRRGLESEGPARRLGCHGLRLLDVRVGMLEQAQPEFPGENRRHRCVDLGLGDLALRERVLQLRVGGRLGLGSSIWTPALRASAAAPEREPVTWWPSFRSRTPSVVGDYEAREAEFPRRMS